MARGMGLADARAICPDLVTRPADLDGELRALAGLARWAGRYAPHVAADGSDGLVADITGVAHLFGGEAELRADLHHRLDQAGLTAASAIAGTRGAAHALARHGGGVLADGALAQGVAGLPVEALRIDHDTAAILRRAGLSRIGDVMDQPRAPLARRFGPALLMRLDQMLGTQAEPVAACSAPAHFGVRMTLPEPIGRVCDVMAGLERLLDRLCDQLALHRRGARRLQLEMSRVDHATLTVQIGLARPMRDPTRIAALFARGLDEIDAGFGIEALRLSAPVTEDQPPEQTGLATRDPADRLADLLSRMGNRIGFDRVLRLQPTDSLIPERSFHLAPAAFSDPAQGFAHAGRPRPLRLIGPEPVQPDAPGTPPAGFSWRARRFTTLRAVGPERIAPEWWLDDPAWRTGLRDYWRVETRQGPRLWLFFTPQSPGWQIAGEFA